MIVKGEATVVKNAGSHYLLSALPEWRLFPAVLRGKIRLKESEIVSCLADGNVMTGIQDIDASADPYGLCLTVPADGSQIKAVSAAADGRSFVMHGPPRARLSS